MQTENKGLGITMRHWGRRGNEELLRRERAWAGGICGNILVTAGGSWSGKE